MLTLYVITALFGGGLVFLSLLGVGDHDGDSASDADGHLELDDHGDSGVDSPWLPFLGLRFWTHFLAAFGVTGVLLHFISAPEVTAAIAALLTGSASGFGISYASRFLKRSEPQSLPSSDDLVGLEGTVTVTVGNSERPGKVRVIARGEIMDLVAECDDPNPLEVSTEIIIVEVRNHRVAVVRRSSLQLESKPAGLLSPGERS